MGKRKTKAKRSLSALPKGLPSKVSNFNPFEVTKKQRRPKHEVLNRFSSTKNQKNPSKLAESLQRRQMQLRATLNSSKKTNVFLDRRIGEYTMSSEDKMLARLVKERTRRSQKVSKYSLEEEEESRLTHRGKSIDQIKEHSNIMLSSDEEDGGDLDAVDTELHFGGSSSRNPYGPSNGQSDMSQLYAQRKNDLDDLINRRKMMKAEKMQSKEKQVETFQSMDDSFAELSKLLQFRDKEKEYQLHTQKKQEGDLTLEDKEMADWDKEMKTYLFERRVKATDRTKTPEEVAKEEAERLHELETRRLARMNGDFEDDYFSDISDGEGSALKVKENRKKNCSVGPESLDDGEQKDERNNHTAKFTADGLVYVDSNGNVIDKSLNGIDDTNKVEEMEDELSKNDSEEEEEEEEDSDEYANVVLSVGCRVKGNYRAEEQYDGNDAWYEGRILEVNTDKAGNVTYSVEYDDGDFESDMKPSNVRPIKIKKAEKQTEINDNEKTANLKRKQKKAKDKARKEIPYVFEVPTTLEALHTVIGNYASTGNEASLIVERIHTSNSVRLDKRNSEKMQNFYDVIIRRFMAVGDAIHFSGDGGEELNRYCQLNSLTRTLYLMSQDAPESSGAVWVRRLGFLQSAHAKRLRDSEFMCEDTETVSAWPSIGVVLLLKALGHIFPVTDKRHQVVTPAMVLLGQFVAQTPVSSIYDIIMGIMCSALLIEYTRETSRVVPEALAFLSGILRLFSSTSSDSKIPTLKDNLLEDTVKKSLMCYKSEDIPLLSLEKSDMDGKSMPVAILYSALDLVEQCIDIRRGSILGAEKELFDEILNSLLSLKLKFKQSLPKFLDNKVQSLSAGILHMTPLLRMPLARRTGPPRQEMAIKSLAPRVEDPLRYSMSKDKGKDSTQAAHDRSRREYKREHKAVARELRMDATFVEAERREEKARRDGAARAKRQKNFNWLEGEQAAMNQQVRQGGGLLSGGGMGAARAKAKSAKMGIKKGGKF